MEENTIFENYDEIEEIVTAAVVGTAACCA